VLIYAHRGASREYPENTLLAFRQALAAGVDGIELDLHATSDGVPVVIHDRGVERTTNGTDYVDAMTHSRLRTFDAGAGERVPTLAEVLKLVGHAVHLDLEIKGDGIADAVLAVLAGFPRARWAISSFDWDTLRDVRRIAPTAELWPLSRHWNERVSAIAAELASPAVALSAGAYTPGVAEAMRSAGRRAVIWTVNDPAEARRMRDLGAYALCTDVPALIIESGVGCRESEVGDRELA
jgi:glycerophosphoryl diester phosphodiesterase